VKLWDTGTAQEAITLRAHPEPVLSAAVSADGQRLASTSTDGQLMVWVAGERPKAEKAARVRGEDPWASTWHRREARKAESNGRWFAAIFHLSRLIDGAPEPSELHVRRGRAFAELGRWHQAAGDFGKAVHRHSSDLRLRRDQALACLAAGDRARYREACAGTLAELSTTDNADVANTAAWICVLAPRATDDPARPVRLAEKAVSGKRTATYLNTLGVALYRADQLDLSIQRLNEAIQIHGNGGTVADWLFLAMAHQRLGQADEAWKWLDKAVQWIDTADSPKSSNSAGPGQPWNDRLEIQLFRREAETLVEGTNP
jgi:tetratricopeptide (TPR) repeat protein